MQDNVLKHKFVHGHVTKEKDKSSWCLVQFFVLLNITTYELNLIVTKVSGLAKLVPLKTFYIF